MALQRVSWKKALAGVGVLLCGGGVFWAVSTLRDASRGLTKAATQVTQENRFAYRSIPLDGPVPAGFEPITSPAQFTDAVLFEGKFYVCGPAGLLAFDLDGKQVAEYHAGLELPPAPLVRMAVGVASQLWIATHGAGLLLFEGGSFRQIRPDSPGARSLTAVLPLATGRVLLGTEKEGVLAWDGKTLARVHPALANLHVTALSGTETDLWVGTLDQGVVHWHAGQADRFSEAEGLPDSRVLSLAAGPSAIYVGTALGVAEFQDGRMIRELGSGYFANSLLVHDDNLEIGTLEEGLIEVPLTVRKPRPRSGGESGTGQVERVLDLNGRLFVLAEDGLYEKGRRILEPRGARLTDRNITALSMDRAGKLWVGYFDRGLDILEPDFEHRVHSEDEHVFCVNRITQAADRAFTAVGTANGLAIFDGGAKPRQVLTKADGLIANNITDVLLRSKGRDLQITVATPAGLTTIDASGTSSLYAFQGLVNNHVYALGSRNSRLMVGTLGGLSMLDAGVVRASYTTANSGLKQNWITAIQAVADEWFIGTYGAGVIKLDQAGRWTTFADLKGQIEVNANAMAATDRAVYAGTLGRGLAVYNRTSERWSLVANGLPSENVTALTVAAGYLYVGTENGLVRIPERLVPTQ